jgi:uncharacterized protein YcnI
MHLRILTAATAAFLAAGDLANAHAVLERREAPADSYFKAVIGIGHGCEGSPTLRVRVRIPEGVISVKPQPKAGWELSIRKDKLPKPVDAGHGRTITEEVAEVTWSGRLLNENYDEFVLQVKLPDSPGETLYFLTVQECEKGVHRWIEIPTGGKARGDYKEPAPELKLLPKRSE